MKKTKNGMSYQHMDEYQKAVSAQMPDRTLDEPVRARLVDWWFGLRMGLKNTCTSILGAPSGWLFGSDSIIELFKQQVRTCAFISAACDAKRLDFGMIYARDLSTPEASHFNEMRYYRKTMLGADTDMDGDTTVYVPERIFDLQMNLSEWNKGSHVKVPKMVFDIGGGAAGYHEWLIKSCDDMGDTQYVWDDKVTDFYEALVGYLDNMCALDGAKARYSVEMWSMAACLCVFAPHPDYEQDPEAYDGMFSTEPILIIPFEQFYFKGRGEQADLLVEIEKRVVVEQAEYERLVKEQEHE